MISKKFKKRLIFSSLLIGLHMTIAPLTVNHWVIRCVGLFFILEAISYYIELVKKYIENKSNK